MANCAQSRLTEKNIDFEVTVIVIDIMFIIDKIISISSNVYIYIYCLLPDAYCLSRIAVALT